jgi:hypothetical protein
VPRSSILSSFNADSLIELSKLLDSTLVGWNEEHTENLNDDESLDKELESFSQRLSQARQNPDGVRCSGVGDPFLTQNDVSR